MKFSKNILKANGVRTPKAYSSNGDFDLTKIGIKMAVILLCTHTRRKLKTYLVHKIYQTHIRRNKLVDKIIYRLRSSRSSHPTKKMIAKIRWCPKIFHILQTLNMLILLQIIFSKNC